MRLTPSQVKNYMRRGLRLLIDPDPSPEDRARCIEFFGHACAYCWEPVPKGRGDLDHLISAAKCGRNHISNRVFACKPCNAELKRDKEWQEFLAERYGADTMYEVRKNKILQWMAEAGGEPVFPVSTEALLKEAGDSVASAFDDACKRLRGAR